VADDAATGDAFGSASSISNNTAVIGAEGDDASQGSAYVFAKLGGTWAQTQKLTDSDGIANDEFGSSVSISSNSIVVSAFGKDSLRGSAYIFTLSSGVWTQSKKLIGTDSVAGDEFGFAVGISGTTVIVSAFGVDSLKGAAYIFDDTLEVPWLKTGSLQADIVKGDLTFEGKSGDSKANPANRRLLHSTQTAR
jgi:uncharacterized membrane protein